MPHRRPTPAFALSCLSLTLAALGGGPALASESAAAKPAAAAQRSDKPDGAPAARAAAPSPGAAVDNLERLRARLAEKLGAGKPADAGGENLVRVSSRTSSASHDERAAPAPRRPAAAALPPTVLAAVDAHRAEKGAVVSAASATAAAHGTGPQHWSYGGDTGPQAWGGLRPEFSLCSNGTRQSPIDIRGGIAVDLPPVTFDYRASGFRTVDNGHTVQVNIGAGNTIQVMGRRYELVQFHFHRPSEERIDGRTYDMDVHLVHKDLEGRLAVVAVLLERGAAQPVVQSVWNNLPLEKNDEVPASAVLDLNHLLPPDRGYYTYMGSLTTPPCSEGVLWMVMRQPVTVSQGQLDIFARLYPMNARPVQAASGRLIKQSQ